ncbi:MAG: type III-B CRISPR-associated protein Cas10/Cmr2 [Kofleriaceae bacterium]
MTKASCVLELKAAALLWRSPLAALDPEGEAARTKELEGWLARQDISLTDADRKLIEGCFHEAQDAALGAQHEMTSASFSLREAPPALRHPLSAEEISPSPDLMKAWQTPQGFLDELPTRSSIPDPADWYRKLWRGLMRHPLFQELPAHATLRDHSVAAHRSMTAALVGARFDGGHPAFLALHVGPVQSFIEAARRTSDLAIGSYTVGYLAFSGAVALAKELGPDVLLNPDVSCRALADKLLFGDVLQGNDKAKLLRAALVNRVLAVVPEAAADRLAEITAKAVSETWRDMGEAAANAWDAARQEPSTARLDREEFHDQLKQHLEIDQVVLPWPKDLEELRGLLNSLGSKEPPWLAHLAGDVKPAADFGQLAGFAEKLLGAHRSALQPLGSRGDHRPKCTNCGRREQLGPRSEKPSQQQRDSREFFESKSEELQQRRPRGRDENEPRTSLQLTRGEGLCAVCLTKRFAAEEYFGNGESLGLSWNGEDRVLLRFPSTATFASAPFRFEVDREARLEPALAEHRNEWVKQLGTLHRDRKLLDFTPPGNLLEGLGPLGRDSDLLSCDGTWFYDLSYVPLSAWRSYFSKDPEDKQRLEALGKQLGAAHAPLRELRRITKKSASEYYAVIVLDGDEMGRWKAGAHARSPTYRELGASLGTREAKARPVHPALYTELSRRVALLNDDLHETVAQHLGRLVYHGGDDVLAFVPIATALQCLHAIQELIRSPKCLGRRVTVSAGLSITHWKTPLSYALSEARRAEKDAKGAGKDRFAISLNPRSGERISLILPWRYDREPSRAGADEAPTIQLLQQLLRAEREAAPAETTSLGSGKAAYLLRDELQALATDELQAAFLHRALQLLFSGSQDELRRSTERLFSCLLGQGSPEGTKPAVHQRMSMVTNLLLLLRFLSRQEQGIDPEALPKAVKQRMTQRGAS